MAERTNPHANLIIGAQDEASPVFDKIKASSQSMAAGVEQAATKAAGAVGGIGDKAAPAAQKLDGITASMIRQVQRLNAELEAGGARNAAFFEKMASVKGADMSALAPYLADLKKAEAAQRVATTGLDQMGMSAKQTAAALRQVPMQFTDIVVSLQGGQSAMQVFLQQGGQLKDMFGGAGNAARALGGYVLGLINPFTIAAAAVAGIAVAYKQGSAEADGYRMALVMTGNAAGTTVGQLADMARAIGEVTGTQGAAAAALTQMAGSGAVARENLQQFVQTAMDLERYVGVPVKSVVGDLESLAKAPLQASLKLNEQYHYLTESVYSHIKALDEQGKKEEAGAAAQRAYIAAFEARKNEIVANLGSIERAWNAVTSAVKRAGDAMLNVGRPVTLSMQIANVRQKIDQAKGLDPNRPFRMPWDTPLAELERQLSYLTEQERMLRRGAEAQAARVQAEEEAIAAADALQRTQDSGLTNQQKMNKALEEYARHIEKLKATNPTSVLLSPDAIERGKNAIRDQFSDKGKGSAGIKAVNKDLADQQRIYAELAGVSSTYHKELAAAQEQRAKGNVSEAQYVAYVNELIQKQPFAVALAKEEAKEQQTLAKANTDAAQAREKYLTSLSAGLDKIRADITAQIEATERLGLSKEAIADLDAAKLEMMATDLELQAIKAMDRNLDEQTYDALKQQAQAYRDLAKAKQAGAARETAVEEANKAADEWQRTSDQINQSLTDALLRGFESGKDFAKNLRDTVVNMFKTMVLRPVISAVVKPVAGAITGALGLSSAAQAGQGGASSGVSTALSGASLISNWMGTGAGAGMGTLAYGNMIGAMGGDGLGAFIAANGGWGTSGAGALANSAGSAFGGAAAGMAVVAAPLIFGMLMERFGNSTARITGAASTGSHKVGSTGSADFDMLTGDTPDRAALLARLTDLGAGVPLDSLNDRALWQMLSQADWQTQQNANMDAPLPIDWDALAKAGQGTADFYRGPGYVNPEQLGWWSNDRYYGSQSPFNGQGVDPAMVAQSRRLAEGVAAPLNAMALALGQKADQFEATVGLAFDPDKKQGWWAGLSVSRDGQNVLDFGRREGAGVEGKYKSQDEALRAMFGGALDAFKSFDLPKWASSQVEQAQTQLKALTGDKIGEQAAALYQQATGGISATFAAIEKMINLFPDFAEASQDAVYALGELTGGLDNLASAYGSYLSNFYSEEERRQLMFKELDSELDKLGIDTIPRTRAEFRELVSAQDLSTEAGREAFTVLMKLSGGFAEFVDAAESAADKAGERIDTIFSQLSDMWSDQIDNWKQLADEAGRIADMAGSAARSLRGNVDETRMQDARSANSYIDQALAGLRATGALPDSKELADAIAAARGGLDMSQYDTVAEMERDQLILAGKLNEIGDSAEVQMSFAEQQVQLLEQQRDYWRQQIDLLTATGETITSIDQGIEYLADYVREQKAIKDAEEAAKEEARRAASTHTSPGGGGWGDWGGGGGQDLTSITRTINWDTGEYVYPDGSGGTLTAEELEYFRRILDGELDPTRIISDLYQVPRHADGGRYAGGLALVGERGPELINFASPGHVYTAVQTRDMMRGGDNAELIAELRELRARLDKIERNTAVLPQTHDVIDRVTAGGNAMLTEAA